ncbi:DUF3244 domain-containing protein [Proteiniphilum sp.]|uniref:DUF3244 domain-containing protein n=1 Tax=Proteiniphilum sp. TaxID=1926877 RepID=UPI0033249DF1
MKSRLLLLTLLSCMSMLSAITVQNTEDSNPITLEGDLQTGSIRKGGNDVTAEVQGNVIVVQFHTNVGNLLVTLTNSMSDTVFEMTVNTSEQSQAFIPLSGLSCGMYTITFSNNFGSLYGDFEI